MQWQTYIQLPRISLRKARKVNNSPRRTCGQNHHHLILIFVKHSAMFLLLRQFCTDNCADFHHHFNLLVDPRQKSFFDSTTTCSVVESIVSATALLPSFLPITSSPDVFPIFFQNFMSELYLSITNARFLTTSHCH